MLSDNIILYILIFVVLLLIYNMVCVNKKLYIIDKKLDGIYTNKNRSHYESAPIIQNTTNNSSTNGVKKFVVYHMKGCGHCHNFMFDKQNNGLSKYEEIKHIFSNDKNIRIIDYQYGRDIEAKKYNAFPTFEITTDNGTIEYRGQREVSSIIDAIKNAK